MSISDYRGREYDLLAYQGGVSYSGEVQLQQQLFSDANGGQIVVGIQKLVQRLLLVLLTEKGSIVHLPDLGTDFITDARLGLMQSPGDVFSSFAAAMIDVRRQLVTEELSTDPADERLDSATLVNVSLANLKASITIEVVSQAGTAARFVQPLDFLV